MEIILLSIYSFSSGYFFNLNGFLNIVSQSLSITLPVIV